MVLTPRGKLLKVLEFPPTPLSRAWKVLEISVGSGKFWKFDVSVWEVVTDYSITFDFANLHYAL